MAAAFQSDAFQSDAFELGGAAAQNLAPSLVSGSAAFFGASVTPGPVSLTQASTVSSSPSFFAATVSAAAPAQSLSTALYSNSASFFAATLTPGAVTLTPTRYNNAATLFAPAVTVGAVTLTPALYTNSASFFAATAAPGALSLSPARVDNAAAFFAPSVSPGAKGVLPPLLVNSPAFYAATVSSGGVELFPPPVSNASAFYGPLISYTLTVGEYASAGYVAPGYVRFPSFNNAQFFSAALAGESVTLAAPRYDNSSALFAPIVSIGAISLAPSLLVNTSAFFSAIALPSNTVAPPLTSNSPQFFAATLTSSDLTLTLTALRYDNAQGFYAPVVAKDSFTITLAQANLLYQIYLLHGLEPNAPLTVSQTQRLAGGIEQAVIEAGGAVTISTVSGLTSPALEAGDMIAELAALHGLTVPLVVTGTIRSAGAISQSIGTVQGVTTVARL